MIRWPPKGKAAQTDGLSDTSRIVFRLERSVRSGKKNRKAGGYESTGHIGSRREHGGKSEGGSQQEAQPAAKKRREQEPDAKNTFPCAAQVEVASRSRRESCCPAKSAARSAQAIRSDTILTACF